MRIFFGCRGVIVSKYQTLIHGEIDVVHAQEKKFWNRCMLYKTGSRDILITCYMRRLYSTDMESFRTKERIKVFEPITNILELKKNFYLIAMTENMVIYNVRSQIKVGKNYRQHKIIKDYNLIELEYIKERRLLVSAGCDGLLVLWRVCFKSELDQKKVENSSDEVPDTFLMKIQKVKFHTDTICRIFSAVFVRSMNRLVICNEGNRLYVFSFSKKEASDKELVDDIEILNAEYIMKDLDYEVAGLYYLDEFKRMAAFHWKSKTVNFLDFEEED